MNSSGFSSIGCWPTPSMMTAPKSAYFLLVLTAVGVKNLYPPAELIHRTGTLVLQQLPRVEAEQVAHEGQRHLRVLTFGLGLEPLLQLGVRPLREQPGDRHTDRLLKILLDAVEHRLVHRLGQFELGVLQGINADHGDDRPRHPLGGQQGDRPAHRVADEDHALQAQRLDHRLDVAGQAIGGPRLAALAGLAVPGLVEGDDAVVAGEHLDLVLPVLAVPAPAVQEDKSRVALAADLADDLQPVVGPEGLLDRLAIGFAADHFRQPERLKNSKGLLAEVGVEIGR